MITAIVSHFEQKFKRKDQARVMLNYYLQQKVMRRVERTLYGFVSCLYLPYGLTTAFIHTDSVVGVMCRWRVRDLSRIVSGFAMLWRTSPRFLLINMSFLPIRVRTAGEQSVYLRKHRFRRNCGCH